MSFVGVSVCNFRHTNSLPSFPILFDTKNGLKRSFIKIIIDKNNIKKDKGIERNNEIRFQSG